VAVFRICFVCMGNICRSPMAATVMSGRIDEAGLTGRIEVDSAGTGGWHAGEPADHRALATLRTHGLDGIGHRARRFDPAWFADRDLVVAMDAENLRALRRLAPPGRADEVVLLRSFDPSAAPTELDVPDPYYEGATGFEHVYDLVDAGCRGLLEHVRRRLR
jgi:protein-tyrosine phosphatase